MRLHTHCTVAALLLLSISPSPTQAITLSGLVPQAVWTYLGYDPVVDAKTDDQAGLNPYQREENRPASVDEHTKDILSLRDCELFDCKVVDGKIVITNWGKTSNNITDPNFEFKEEYGSKPVSPEEVEKDPLLVQTKNGPLQGFYNHGFYRGVRHHMFDYRDTTPRGWVGIPFALPPTKAHRFTPPRPYTRNWGPTARMALTTPKACPQAGLESYSDDCLYLNVYTPSTKRMKELGNKKLPVFFFIYGGGFNIGSGYMYGIYDGRHITKTQDAIVVVASHRVGVMGFLVADTPKPITGNMAIKDQILALQWVHDNIEGFGGDKNNVAIAGLSSGATSVLIHLISDATPAHLFHKAIILSAPFGQYSRTPAEMKEISLKIVDQVGCVEETNGAKRVNANCLRDLPVKDLIKATAQEPDQWDPAYNVSRPLSTHYYWWPHVDGEILKKEPLDSILAGEFKRVPIVIGVMREEMGYFTKFSSIPYANWLSDKLGWRKFFTKDNLQKQRQNLFKSKEIDQMLEKYYPLKDDERANEMMAVQLGTDSMFRCPTVQMADLLARENKEVYVYEVIHPAQFIKLGRCSDDMACHAFDLPYMWRPYFVWLSKDEIKLSDHYNNYLFDFISGNISKRAKVPWPRYSSEKKEYMNLAPNPMLGHGLRKDYCKEVWSKIGYKF
jgi:para-nitrobenzyl esterase